MMPPLHANKEKVNEVNALLQEIAPQLKKLVVLLHACGLRDFEFMLGHGADRFTWNTGMPTKHVRQDELAIELKHILDEVYPPKTGLQLLGLAFGYNKLLADKLAELLYSHHRLSAALLKASLLETVSMAGEQQPPATKVKV